MEEDVGGGLIPLDNQAGPVANVINDKHGAVWALVPGRERVGVDHGRDEEMVEEWERCSFDNV